MGRATLYVELPEWLARLADEAERESPGFLERILKYATTRRLIYRHLAHEALKKPEGGARA